MSVNRSVRTSVNRSVREVGAHRRPSGRSGKKRSTIIASSSERSARTRDDRPLRNIRSRAHPTGRRESNLLSIGSTDGVRASGSERCGLYTSRGVRFLPNLRDPTVPGISQSLADTGRPSIRHRGSSYRPTVDQAHGFLPVQYVAARSRVLLCEEGRLDEQPVRRVGEDRRDVAGTLERRSWSMLRIVGDAAARSGTRADNCHNQEE